MYIPFTFAIIIQVICAVHAINTGRRQWLWIILIFSVVGCLVYFIIEVLPELKPVADEVASGTQNIVTPNHKVVKLKNELEVCDTVENRVALAGAYLDRKQFAEAIEVLEICRSRPHGDDPEVIEQLALAYYSKKDYQKAKDCLTRMKASQHKFENQRVHLLYALSLQKLNESEAAIKEYEELMRTFVGEEARCRYALLIKKQGRLEEANKIFTDIIKKCKMSPAFYRRENKVWYEGAQSELKKK